MEMQRAEQEHNVWRLVTETSSHYTINDRPHTHPCRLGDKTAAVIYLDVKSTAKDNVFR